MAIEINYSRRKSEEIRARHFYVEDRFLVQWKNVWRIFGRENSGVIVMS